MRATRSFVATCEVEGTPCLPLALLRNDAGTGVLSRSSAGASGGGSRIGAIAAWATIRVLSTTASISSSLRRTVWRVLTFEAGCVVAGAAAVCVDDGGTVELDSGKSQSSSPNAS